MDTKINQIRFQRLIQESLFASTREQPDKSAVVAEGTPYTFAHLQEDALRMADALFHRGIQRGDRVAVYMDNTYPCIVSIFGILTAGATFLAVNPQTKADKLRFILNDCGVRCLVTDAHLYRVFSQIISEVPSVAFVICSGELPSPQADTMPLEPFEQVLLNSSPTCPPVSVIPTDLAALIYTSGSTGNPKGVMMTHQNMVFTTESLSEYLRLDHTHRILNLLPLAFDYGLYQLLMSVRMGATLVLERSFAFPPQIFFRMEENSVTVFPGVPTIFATMMGIHRRNPLRFTSVLRVTNTAAALPSDYLPALKEIFPNALIYKMYGLTECKRVSYLEPELLDSKPTSVGKAIPGTEVFLRSPEGDTVPTGEPGILHVRGPHVMKGYWNNPEQTAKMLKEGPVPGEKILCAQDWFVMDDEGFLYFKGRSDDIIKTRGEKVSPVEVENALYSIDGIREAAVVGVPDPILGQAIKAFVALHPGVTLNEKEIRKICMTKMENFMVPAVIVILNELPKTTTGKIRKQGLPT